MKSTKLLGGICIMLLLSLPNCAETGMHGKTLEPDPGIPDQFRFKVYTGGFAGSVDARLRAEREIEEFMALHNYSKFQILNERCELWPLSGCNFVVKLER